MAVGVFPLCGTWSFRLIPLSLSVAATGGQLCDVSWKSEAGLLAGSPFQTPGLQKLSVTGLLHLFRKISLLPQ
jgi:hypothetical protein